MQIKNIFLIFFSIIISIFLCNIFFVIYKSFLPLKSYNSKSNSDVYFDTRDRLEVIESMRSEGVDCQPLFFPFLLINEGIVVNGNRYLPLSGISNSIAIHCNECGEYPIYKTDGYGFNNPPLTHTNEDFDVALIGDSYTFGLCVDSSENLSSNLSRLGIKNISYGHGGNGPLLELATLSEYSLLKKIKYYVWLCYGFNDLDDILRESKSSVLMEYLNDSSYRQGLIEIVPELDDALKCFIKDIEYEQKVKFNSIALDLLLCRTLRGYIGLSFFESAQEPDYEAAVNLFGKVIREAEKRVKTNGSKFLFVYLPGKEFFVEDKFDKHGIIIKKVKELGIDFLDMTDVFLKTGKPKEFFPFELAGHYNANGYRLLAKSIQKYLASNY